MTLNELHTDVARMYYYYGSLIQCAHRIEYDLYASFTVYKSVE